VIAARRERRRRGGGEEELLALRVGRRDASRARHRPGHCAECGAPPAAPRTALYAGACGGDAVRDRAAPSEAAAGRGTSLHRRHFDMGARCGSKSGHEIRLEFWGSRFVTAHDRAASSRWPNGRCYSGDGAHLPVGHMGMTRATAARPLSSGWRALKGGAIGIR